MDLRAEQILAIPDEEILRLRQAVDAELALREYADTAALSLERFVRGAWHIVEPKTRLLWNWHLTLICQHLEAVSRGEIRRLIINVPPGCMKSLLVMVMWPAWEWLTRPEMRLQCLAKAPGVVTRDSMKMRAIVKSEWYRKLADAVARNTERNPWDLGPRVTQRTIENTATGIRVSLTIGADVAGERCYRQAIDDPHDIKDVTLGTQEQIQQRLDNTNATINKTLASRVQSQDGESYVLVMQRVHENDATAEWQKLYPHEVVVLCLPMRYEPEHPQRCADDPRTQRGELLHPNLYGDVYVEALARALGDQASAQLDQLPIPPQGGTYRAEWWREYLVAPRDLQVDEIAMAIDANVKETKHGSYFCAQVWGRRWRQANGSPAGFDRYLLDRIIGRWEHHEAKEAVKRLRWSWPACSTIAIEDKANGPALGSDLRQLFSGVVMVPRRSDRSKEVFNQVQGVPPIQAGEVYLPKPEHAPWIHDFRAQVERFPATPNDDADTLSIMFMHWDGDRSKQSDDPVQQLRGNIAALSWLE